MMDFYERALEQQEETVTHRRWLHRNTEVGLHTPKGQTSVQSALPVWPTVRFAGWRSIHK